MKGVKEVVKEPSLKETDLAAVPGPTSIGWWLKAAGWILAALNREWLLLLPTSDSFRLFQRELLPSAPITEPFLFFSRKHKQRYSKYLCNSELLNKAATQRGITTMIDNR